jgi:hypothetical protein
MSRIKKIWNNKSKIIDGVKNNLFKKEHVEIIATKRLNVCKSCEEFDGNGKTCLMPGTQPCCGLCGCSLAFKTRSLSSKCDINKWIAEVTEEEEDVINDKLKVFN